MRFLPTLLNKAAVSPMPVSRPVASDMQVKLLLADYYTTLANAGVTLGDQARPWPIERAVAEGYDRVVWAFKAVSAIGENTARDDVPFEVVEGAKHQERTVDDHPIARLLNGQANPVETGEVFLDRLSAQILLSKRGAFVEVTKSNSGAPIRLDLLPPTRVRIVPDRDGAIDHYEVTTLNGVRRTCEPDQIRWIRKPHPIDPYSGVTPLESAGLSVELDYFARLYNVSFMRNDGRPGGIVGITGPDHGAGLNDEDMERLEARFGRGPMEAGKVSVVEGDVSYADLAAKPRDSQYQGVSRNAKTEILGAFGVPESVLGNSSERTYANAEAEAFNFWRITMIPHLGRIAAAFLPDVEDGQRPRFNLDAIDVLELPAREARREAREEVAMGLRSIKSYAELAGYGDQVEDLPHMRAHWIASGKTPLPAREADAAALGAGAPADPGATSDTGAPADPNAVPDANAAPPDANAAPAPAGAPAPPAPPPAGMPPLTGTGAGPAATPRTDQAAPPPDVPAQRTQRKSSPAEPGQPAAPLFPADTAPYAESAIYSALEALVPRWTERAGARLKSPKTRKGTRHFVAEFERDTRVGTKALDAAYAADEASWSADAESAARHLIGRAGVAAATAWWAAAAGAEHGEVDLPAEVKDAALDAALAAVPPLITGAAWQARHAARAIAAVDASGGSVDDAVRQLARRGSDIRTWAQQAAADAAATATDAGHRAAERSWARLGEQAAS